MEEKLAKLELLFVSPGRFFSSMKHEKTYIQPLLSFAILYVLYAFFANILFLVFRAAEGMLASALVVFPGRLILDTMAAFALPFFASALVHLGLVFLQKDVKFFHTFRAVTYSGVIVIVYLFFMQLLNLIFLIIGINKHLPQGILAFIYGGIIVLLFLIAIVHHLTAEITGLAMYHNITQIKAFLGIILVPLILSILGAIILASGTAVIFSITGMFL